MSSIRNTVLEKIAFRKPVCLTGLVQRNKHVKFTLDLIVYFEYSVIESFLKALSVIDVDVLCRIHKLLCNFAVFLCRLLRNFVFV